MGYYVNPEEVTKEEWLVKNATPLTEMLLVDWQAVRDENMLPVVLINNGAFTAAGIAFSKSELEAFTSPDDYRPKKYYKASTEKLKEVSDLPSSFGV